MFLKLLNTISMAPSNIQLDMPNSKATTNSILGSRPTSGFLSMRAGGTGNDVIN